MILLLFIQCTLFSQSKSDSTKKVQVVAIPTFGFNNSFGAQIGALAMAIFQVNRQDSISPPSNVNFFGFYTTNNSYMGVIYPRLYWAEDKYRVEAAVGVADFNFQFYASDVPMGGGDFIDYTTTSRFVYGAFYRNLFGRLYGGVGAIHNRLNTDFVIPQVDRPVDTAKVQNAIGLPFSFDTRDNVFTPSKGFYSNLKFFYYPLFLGSDLEFSNLNFDLNHYHRINKQSVLASRAKTYFGFGTVYFEAQKIIGRTDLRGYSQGEYRGDKIISFQTEYRHTIKSSKWGYVAFAGLAGAYNSLNQMGRWSGVLPAGGAGIRFKILPSRNLNAGIDAALGKDDWGLYFRIREAF